MAYGLLNSTKVHAVLVMTNVSKNNQISTRIILHRDINNKQVENSGDFKGQCKRRIVVFKNSFP